MHITTITSPNFLRYSLYLFVNIHMGNSAYFEVDFCGSMCPKRWYEQNTLTVLHVYLAKQTFDDDTNSIGMQIKSKT